MGVNKINISLNIILNCIQKFNPIISVNNFDKSFESLKLFSSDDLDFKEDTLYCGFFNEIKELNQQKYNNIYFLCIDDTEIKQELKNIKLNLILISNNYKLSTVFNKLQEVFINLFKWNTDIDMAITDGKSIQDLLVISSKILNLPILIWDSLYYLIAHTNTNKFSKGELDEIINLGYLPNNILAEFAKKKYTVNSRKFSNDKYTKKYFYCDILNCNLSIRSFYLDDEHIYTMVIYFINKQNDSISNLAITDLFILLSHKIDSYLKSDKKNYKKYRDKRTIFLTDLIEGNITEKEFIKERSAYLGLKFNDNFRLCVITLDNFSITLTNYIFRTFHPIFPYTKMFIHNNFFISLDNIHKIKDSEMLNNKYSQFKEVLTNINGYAGLSSFFQYIR